MCHIYKYLKEVSLQGIPNSVNWQFRCASHHLRSRCPWADIPLLHQQPRVLLCTGLHQGPPALRQAGALPDPPSSATAPSLCRWQNTPEALSMPAHGSCCTFSPESAGFEFSVCSSNARTPAKFTRTLRSAKTSAVLKLHRSQSLSCT